ncbi:MAG: c-type cytochrome, partial [Myxococcaceae bacterium]
GDMEALKVANEAVSSGAANMGTALNQSGLSAREIFRITAMIAVACLVAGTATYAGIKVVQTVPPIIHIQNQPKLNPQRASTFFADGRGMRSPVAGTVARGQVPYLFKTPEEAGAVLVNPLPLTAPVLEKGRRAYATQCSVCHGALGTGESTLSSAYGAKPANLQSAAIRDYPDGRLYHVIMTGKNAMPSYAADLSEDERWSIVHYLRALHRSQNARDEDVR